MFSTISAGRRKVGRACRRPGGPKAGSLLAHPPSATIPLRLLGGGASFTSATTGLSQNAHPSRRDGRAQVVALLLAPLPGRMRVLLGIRWLRSLHSLHHRLPAFVPSGR